MKTVLVKAPVVASGVHLEPGQVYDLPRHDALILLRMGKAVPFDGDTVQVTTRGPEINSSMTVKQIKAELDAAGVSYPDRATKKQLLELG